MGPLLLVAHETTQKELVGNEKRLNNAFMQIMVPEGKMVLKSTTRPMYIEVEGEGEGMSKSKANSLLRSENEMNGDAGYNSRVGEGLKSASGVVVSAIKSSMRGSKFSFLILGKGRGSRHQGWLPRGDIMGPITLWE